MPGDGGLSGERDAVTGRRGDAVTGRHGDTVTERHGEGSEVTSSAARQFPRSLREPSRFQRPASNWEPGYLALHRSGELAARAWAALDALRSCDICPRVCGVDRMADGRGACGVGIEPVIAAWNVHMWEEPPITGTRGSGTIFFSGCTGKCIFCQNYPISQYRHGNTVSIERFAGMMLELQGRGVHNINFVTPTHFVPANPGRGGCCSGARVTPAARL